MSRPPQLARINGHWHDLAYTGIQEGDDHVIVTHATGQREWFPIGRHTPQAPEPMPHNHVMLNPPVTNSLCDMTPVQEEYMSEAWSWRDGLFPDFNDDDTIEALTRSAPEPRRRQLGPGITEVPLKILGSVRPRPQLPSVCPWCRKPVDPHMEIFYDHERNPHASHGCGWDLLSHDDVRYVAFGE